MMIKDQRFQHSISLSFFVCLFVLLQTIVPVLSQNVDRRDAQPPANQGINIDFTRGSSSFYYVDQIGISLGMSGMAASDIIDLETYLLGPGDLLTIILTGNVSGVFRVFPVNQ